MRTVTAAARGEALCAIANPEGVISALALDHGDAMRNAFRRAGVPAPSDTAMLETKLQILDVLDQGASAILLDPAAAKRRRPNDVGLIMPLEAQGYRRRDGGRLTDLAGNFEPANAAALGADACKLLLYYRADHSTAGHQRELAARVAASCHQHGLPLVLEPLAYRLDGESAAGYRSALPRLIQAAASELAGSGADLLKLQFPGDLEACERVSAAASPLHWTLLGGGDVDGDRFAAQLEIACHAGACGFIAGRPIWGGALGLSSEEQTDWIRKEALPLLLRLSAVVTEHGRPIR